MTHFPSTNIPIFLTGDWNYANSYGLIAIQLARHLERLGATVSAQGLGKIVVDNQPDDVKAITMRGTPPDPGGIYLGVSSYYAMFGERNREFPNIALTMFESSLIPIDWVHHLNGYDAVIVPTSFCEQSFRESGVTVPIHIIPLGITETYQYVERDPDRPITFLAFMDWGSRKGGIVAQQAFTRAFGDDTRYKLILKGREKPMPKFSFTNPNMEVIQQDMSDAEMQELYARCDVMIAANKGEGFGLLPREFAATGGISLATDWGGTADHLDLWGWPIEYRLEKADWRGHNLYEGQNLGDWAIVDPKELAVQLQDVAADIDLYRKVAKERCNEVKALYSWSEFASSVYSLWLKMRAEQAEMYPV